MPRQLTLGFRDDGPGQWPQEKERGAERSAQEAVGRIAAMVQPLVLDTCAPPALDAGEITGNELAKRQLLVAAAGKGHAVIQQDFLTYHGEHDVIVMNPPFEDSQEIEHVQHAYEQLARGGRLVSVMSAGPFFRSDKKAEEFRKWLVHLGAEVENLPDDAFQGIEAFRQAGVRTKLVFITKETGAL